mgnify:CR=1 FL=1
MTTRAAWAQQGKHYDLPAEIRTCIENHMETCALINNDSDT